MECSHPYTHISCVFLYHFPLCSFETVLLTESDTHCFGWTSCIFLSLSPPLTPLPTMRPQAYAATPRTQVFIPVQQASYPLSHHPCHEFIQSSLSYLTETSNSFFISKAPQVVFILSLAANIYPLIRVQEVLKSTYGITLYLSLPFCLLSTRSPVSFMLSCVTAFHLV